jgi:hypothetical protein
MMSLTSSRAAPLGALLCAAAAAFTLACSSSSGSESGDGGSGGTGSSSACTYLQGGITECFMFANLTSAQAAKDDMNCATTQPDGKVVDTCPSEGLIGCCRSSIGPEIAYACSYEGDGGGTLSQIEGQCEEGDGGWSTSPPP